MDTLCCLSVQTYSNGKLALEKKQEDGKGKCPFDPFQRYASIMVGEQQLHNRQEIEEELFIQGAEVCRPKN